MSTPVTWNGTIYNIPAAGDLNWSSLSNFLIALGNNAAISGGAVTYGSRVVSTTPDTVGPTDTVILNEVSSSSNINLPTTVGNSGRILVIVDAYNSARSSNRPITINAFSGNLINGAATYVINSDGGAVILVGASNCWVILGAYEGSQILNSRTTATNANTASAIVARDASGNFTAGTITAALTGNATTATTAANLSGSNLTGDVTNVANAMTIPSGTITNAKVNASAGIVDTKLATISTAGKVSNSATTATNANTASAIVARDASGNFTAGTITAALSGNATTATTATSATSAANLTGSNLTGDVTNVANAMTIPSGTITNAMVNASAGIVDTKLATISTALKVSNSATTAASANTASAIVARDASGNFTAGTITAALTGNASTATSAANLTGSNLTGDVTNVANAMTIPAGTITNAMVNASAGIVDTKLATISTASKVSNSATTATSANTNSAIVARNSSGDFSAGAVTVTQLNSTGVVGLAQIATPTAPLSTVTNVYAKTDGKIYRQTSDGEFGIGSGSGSGINYLTDWNDGSKSVNLVSTVAAAGNVSVTGSYTTATSAWYADATSGASVTAGSFVVGKAYVITFVGSTNFVSIGAASSTVGVTFIATGVGSGTGTAGSSAIYSNANITLRGTTNYLTQLSSASTSGATFVQSPVFCVDGTDLGKALAVQFDVIGNTTADDWDVVAVRYDSAGTFGALIPIAGIASSTTGTASAQVPTGTTTFRGFFITNSTASDVYSIRWRRRAGSVAIRLDNLIVGPNSVMTGTAITDWQAYTPTFTGFGTATAVEMFYRRVGDTLQVRGNFTCGTNTATEARMSIPTGLVTAAFPSIRIAGTVIPQGSSTTYFGSYLLVEPSVSYFTFGMQFSTINALTKTNANNFTSSGKITIEGEVPIVGYSSNVTMADRAVEEYASNGAAAGVSTNDTTDFKYGPAGSQIGAITTGHFKRVRFQTVVQATDNIIVELRDPQTNVWSALGNSFATQGFGSQVVPWSISGSTQVGMGRLAPFSSTDVDVYFASVPNAGTSAVWGATATPGTMGSCFWRIRKVSGGAAVGFPVGARNVIGDTTGTAVPSGYIGEIQSITGQTGTFANGANITSNMTSLSLGIGTWYITAGAQASGTTMNYWRMSISSSTASFDFNNGIQPQSPLSGGYTSIGRVSTVLNITAPTTIYLVENHWIASGTNTFTNAEIRAVRIA